MSIDERRWAIGSTAAFVAAFLGLLVLSITEGGL